MKKIYPLEQIFAIIEDDLLVPGEDWQIKEEISYHADKILHLCDKLWKLGDRSMEGIVEGFGEEQKT